MLPALTVRSPACAPPSPNLPVVIVTLLPLLSPVLISVSSTVEPVALGIQVMGVLGQGVVGVPPTVVAGAALIVTS